MIRFPQNFLWGAATSSYQVEGDNSNCDWWLWEKETLKKEFSGPACRHYLLFKQDFDLAKALYHNTHRLSIEWSRIEPEEGKFSAQEIAHYRDVILALKERKLEPVVTLHHFTNPAWLAKKGGWQNSKSAVYFLRYARIIVEALGENVKYWITINEPLVYSYHAYLIGVWPPQKKSFAATKFVENNFAVAHIKVFKFIHDFYRKNKYSPPLVSIAQNIQAFRYCRPTLKNKIGVYLRDKYYNFSFIARLKKAKALDFIGVNYYTRGLVDVKKWGLSNLFLDNCTDNHMPLKKNSLGWDIYPQGLYDLLLKFKKFNLPVLITENGICTENDTARWDYISEHLKVVHAAISKGVNVIGYIYWSLMDNFEWDKGFAPRFGIIEIDYKTFERKPRESAFKFSQVCKTGALE